jgi:hypothetical protein
MLDIKAITSRFSTCDLDDVVLRIVQIDNPITKWHFHMEDRDDTDVTMSGDETDNDDNDDNDGDLIDRRYEGRHNKIHQPNNNNQMGPNNNIPGSLLGKRGRRTKRAKPRKRAKHRKKTRKTTSHSHGTRMRARRRNY